MQLIDERGPDALTFQAVADRVGVAHSALYHHVPSVAALQRAVVEELVVRLRAGLVQAAMGRAGADAIVAMAHAWRAFAARHAGSYRLLASLTADHIAGIEELMMLLVDTLERAGHAEDAAVDLARLVRSAVHGFVSLEATGGFVLPAASDSSFEVLVDTLQRTIDRPAPTTSEGGLEHTREEST